MATMLTPEQAQAVLDSLKKAISAGPWEKSNFLRFIGQSLQRLHDSFQDKMNASKPKVLTVKEQTEKDEATELRSQNEQDVYVALYCSSGSDMHAWERIISNVGRQFASRPVYADEEAVLALLREKKTTPQNEGYIVVTVAPNDILVVAEDKIPKDKFGKTLLLLKNNTLRLERMKRFVHTSGVYSFVHGRLVLEPPKESS
ncbi:MAG: Dot/Icm secretion system protein IcmQ [Legionellaceae bacterium]|nr:Dot/Icm secretion system protein IcmQ [Legionellaceae bacterium]